MRCSLLLPLVFGVMACNKTTQEFAGRPDTTAIPTRQAASGRALTNLTPIATTSTTESRRAVLPVATTIQPNQPEAVALGVETLPAGAQPRALGRACNAFAMDLWTRLGKSDGGNLAISPAGISLALSMTWAGAKLHTAAEMQRVLHLNSDAASIATGWKAILETWTAPGRSLELHVANRLYGEQSYEFEQPFLDLTRTRFKAPLELVNLKSDSEAARQRINAWVGEVTRQRLQELVPTGALDRRARLVLVNAIYFLGTWAEPFLKESTRSADFHVSPGVNRRVPMMNRTGSYRFLHESGVSVIEVPYSDKDATLLVVLPDAPEGLRSLERSLSLAQLEGWLKQLRPSDVALSLPRFEAKSPVLSLPQLLSSLGMPLAFDRRRADFTGIGKPTALDERLTLGPLFHQAFVKVDENGTEAAAATAVVAVAAGAALAPVEFKADHPFLFLLLDKASGLILFLGRVADPT